MSKEIIYGTVYEKSLKGREVEHIKKFTTKKELINYVLRKYTKLGWGIRILKHSNQSHIDFILKYIG